MNELLQVSLHAGKRTYIRAAPDTCFLDIVAVHGRYDERMKIESTRSIHTFDIQISSARLAAPERAFVAAATLRVMAWCLVCAQKPIDLVADAGAG
jgi:hypothetical protein